MTEIAKDSKTPVTTELTVEKENVCCDKENYVATNSKSRRTGCKQVWCPTQAFAQAFVRSSGANFLP